LAEIAGFANSFQESYTEWVSGFLTTDCENVVAIATNEMLRSNNNFFVMDRMNQKVGSIYYKRLK